MAGALAAPAAAANSLAETGHNWPHEIADALEVPRNLVQGKATIRSIGVKHISESDELFFALGGSDGIEYHGRITNVKYDEDSAWGDVEFEFDIPDGVEIEKQILQPFAVVEDEQPTEVPRMLHLPYETDTDWSEIGWTIGNVQAWRPL